jgi:hypothetical protein
LRRIADRLDADYDDHYLGIDRGESDQERFDLEELHDQTTEVLREHADLETELADVKALAAQLQLRIVAVDQARLDSLSSSSHGLEEKETPRPVRFGHATVDEVPVDALSVLQTAYAAHSAILASALEIVTSYADSLDVKDTATSAAHGLSMVASCIFRVLRPLHPAGLAPTTLPELLEADAEHRERLAKAFEIVSSLADWLDEDCGIGSGDDLRAFLDSSGILRILSPEHVSNIACVAGRQRYFDIVNDKEADEPKLSRLGVAGADEVRSDKFTIVPNGALLDQAAGVNHVPVFEPRTSLRGVEERESAVAVVASVLASPIARPSSNYDGITESEVPDVELIRGPGGVLNDFVHSRIHR